MIKKLEPKVLYYQRGTAMLKRDYTEPYSIPELVEKINEIVDYINKEKK